MSNIKNSSKKKHKHRPRRRHKNKSIIQSNVPTLDTTIKPQIKVKCINCKKLYRTLEFDYVCRRCILTKQEVNTPRYCNQYECKLSK